MDYEFIMKLILGSIEESLKITSQQVNYRDLTKEDIYNLLEHNCDTNLTDEDMIRLHIDIALQNDDKETFMKLTEQLKEGDYGLKLHV